MTKFNVKLNFDGFMIKMRVKKEITHFKVIGLHIAAESNISSLHTEDNSIDLKAKLEDLQVLHQQNELVFKHNYVSGADNLDIYDTAFDDEAYVPGSLIRNL